MLSPRHYGPSIALVLLVLVPRAFYADNSILQAFTPSLWIIVIWYVRTGAGGSMARRSNSQSYKLVNLAILVATGWFALSLLWSISFLTSIAWIFPYVVGVLLVVQRGFDRQTVGAFRKTWVILASIVAAYALLEFALQANPIYDSIRDALNRPLIQKWSSYRSNASLGHPLYAALFFSISSALAYGVGITLARKWYFVAAAICAVATVTTLSRAGLIALGVALVAQTIVAIFARTKIRGAGKALLSVLLAAGMIVLLQLPQLQQRFLSEEALASSAARGDINDIALNSLEAYRYHGAGIGTSFDAVASFNPYELLVENGYYQVLIGAGPVGLILFGLVIIIVFVIALRRAHLAAVGMILAYGIMIGTFNIIDSNPGLILILGLIVAYALAPQSEITDHVDDLPATVTASPTARIRSS